MILKCLIYVIVKKIIYLIWFLIIYSVFLEKVECINILIFCESEKNEKMLNRYVQVTDKIKEEVLSFIDDNLFILCKDFMRFRFKTNDKLPYNQKINALLCVISISSVLNKGDWYYF